MNQRSHLQHLPSRSHFRAHYRDHPSHQIFTNILCTTISCNIGLEETVTVSKTHSAEAGFSVEVSVKPFGVGMAFTVSAATTSATRQKSRRRFPTALN